MLVCLGTGTRADMKRTETSFVFQNIDGDGAPTQVGDIVALVECPRHLDRIWKWGLPNHVPHRAEVNYRVAVFTKPEAVGKVKMRSVLVHHAMRRPPTPRRTWLVLDTTIDVWEVRILVGHAVNSAWRPKYVPTTFREIRQRLWKRWFEVGQGLVDQGHDQGRLVIVLCDGNRARGQWKFRGTRNAWSEGTDEVFVSQRHPADPLILRKHAGAKTGNGRVTHKSMKFFLSLLKK